MASTFRRSTIVATASYAVRRAVWAGLRRHRPGSAPPILIFTSRRSGGSWLTDALAAEQGLLGVLQPFAIGLSDPFLRFDRGVPASLRANVGVPRRPQDEPWMAPLFERIFDGSLRIGWAANPLSPRFQRRTDRVLVKLHNVKAWIDWFEETFPAARIVFHLRHPIPQALSSMRMGWPDRTLAYLEDQRFVETCLPPELERETRKLEASADPFEKAVLGWLIENRAPLRLLESGLGANWLVTTYEEAARNPADVFRRLIAFAGLRCSDTILKRAGAPSHTVFDPAKTALIHRAERDAASRSRLVAGWQDEVAPAQLDKARRLFELFDLKFYSADSPRPRR